MALNFMYIGASRAGSTYLTEVLRNHPEVALPLGKPVRYWNRHIDGGVGIKQPVYKVWAPKYYDTAMNKFPQKINGDITDGYTQIPPERIQHIHNRYPDVKVLYCIRNPFDVILSHYGLKGRIDSDVIELDVLQQKILAKDSYWANNIDFAGNIKRWKNVFGENFMVYKFEDMVADPVSKLKQICKFIGARPRAINNIHPDVLHKKRNTRQKNYDFTPEAHAWLNDYCRDNMIEAAELSNLNLRDYYT
jgi:LPS sulfotransferase NodH